MPCRLPVNEVTQIGLEVIAAAFAYGAAAVRVILRAKPRHDHAGLYNTIALAEPILAGSGSRANVSRRSRPMTPLPWAKRCARLNPANRLSRPADLRADRGQARRAAVRSAGTPSRRPGAD